MQLLKNFLKFLVLVISPIPLLAQGSSSSYFPMQIGNYWEYWGGMENPEKRFVLIKGDTLMPNGKKYFKFYYQNIGDTYSGNYRYFRSEGDSLIFRYTGDNLCNTQEEVLYNFSAKDSSYWQVCSSVPGSHPPEKTYYYAIWKTFIEYYPFPGFSGAVDIKRFTNVLITKENGKEEITWSPRVGIGFIDIVKGIGEYRSWYDLSPEWRLVGAIINENKYGTVTYVDESQNKSLLSYQLNAYPNPFNPTTNIRYSISVISSVQLKIYDILGNEIKTLVNETMPAGSYTVKFDGSALSSGVYIYTLQAGEYRASKKLLLLQ